MPENASRTILLLDGGLGTSLQQKYKAVFNASTPLWSSNLLVSDPDTLAQCQADFGRVPVDILLTATYQVSIEGFRRTRSAEYPDGIPREAIPSLVSRAVDIAAGVTTGSVALSVGPYGACMVPSQEYSGDYDIAGDELCVWHRERLLLYRDVAGRIGYVALETIPRVDEIRALRRALESVSEFDGVRFWMACVFPGNGSCLPDGETVDEALRAMFDKRVARRVPWGVGINCTKVWKLTALLGEYERVVADLLAEGVLDEWPALVLYPDGTNGQVYNTVTQEWEMPVSDTREVKRLAWEEQLASVVRGTEARGRWKQIVVGGCCMASPEDISLLRTKLSLC